MNTAPIAIAALALLGLAGTVQAHEEIFVATLSGAAENPSNNSPATGSVKVVLDLDTLLMEVIVDFSGLTVAATASHIHCCTTTPNQPVNVGVATMTPSFIDFPKATSGHYDHTFDMALASSYNSAFITANGGVSGAFTALVHGMEQSRAYLNIHDTNFPGGEIRGFLAPVPEPATYGLMLMGLAGLGGLARRRAR